MIIRKLPKSQLELKITVPAKELEKFLDMAAEELSKDFKIAGFRPGKAPRKIVEQQVGSEKVLAHAAEKAVRKTYTESIIKNKIEAIGEPKITITKIAPGNDLEFKAVIAIMPEISLGDYKKSIKGLKKSELEKIKPEEIKKELDILRKSRAKLITVSREARKNDYVEIDFDVFLIEEKSASRRIEGGKSQNHPLTIGESYFIPGFEENLIGMKANDEKEFDLEFPRDYHKKELAGKPAKFKVKMNLVQEKILPEMNDDFAKSLGKFENLESLKKSVFEGMEIEQRKKNKEKRRQEIIEKIISDYKTEIPEILLENEIDKMMAEFEQNIAGMGMKVDDYFVNIKKTRSEVRNSWKESAEKRVKSALALREIAKLENLSPESAEIEEEMNKTLAYFKGQRDMERNVDMERLYDYVKGTLTNQKVFEFLEKL
ncbi:MAG: Trigger factor [Candidatus Moranbacteria bacterium GW2011_GWC1_45_18]|nr:MAG: Trigger factor [Candidatus Moranbacteria bacterium GW2011_GWC2_40_12]KKT71525.1 MAG: Trigger factor [Candidatus Moranbacteria bacterium GW2011_GWF1_44_4]KKU00708.1 MAG: Trigger factor [Candidatus Moranbacteria bacterium GW2011_GWC1_45_18]OGI24267.1 MAG: trigger factor [Candidatus Moranbacteria bacterium RIFOXYA1_FULL_44_8]OGI35834.1 MAG: trigger factor [Candidatus Moranbacteria bacterium RIFOXYC1_FULL_44_8]OGI39974.1 MAG: trigger factor [Candidatus Moranbacteria bacterium RIFOXYB1_FULL